MDEVLLHISCLTEVSQKSFAFKLSTSKFGESLAEQLPFQLSSIERQIDKTERWIDR